MGVLLVSLVAVSLVTAVMALLLSLLFNGLKGKVDIRIKYWLWIGLLVSLLLPFRPRFGAGLFQIQREQLALPLSATVGLSKVGSSAQNSGFWAQLQAFPWVSALFWVWLSGVLVSLGIKAYQSWQFHRLLKRWGSPVTERSVLDSLAAAKELVAVVQPITVRQYPLAQSPMLVGLRQPMVLLPHLDYTDEELDLIFEHELTHFKHRDIYVNLLAVLVTSLHWFNPLVAFMAKETQEVAETYCDHDVLVYQDKAYRTFYGETIISMIDKSRQRTSVLSSCFYSNKFNLRRRMEAIVTTEPSTKSLTALAVLVVTAAVLFSGSVFALVESTPLVAEVAKSVNTFSPEILKEKVSDRLDLPLSVLSDWDLREDDNRYLIRVTHKGEVHTFTLSKWSGHLQALPTKDDQAVPAAETTRSTTSSSSSSAATQTAISEPSSGQEQPQATSQPEGTSAEAAVAGAVSQPIQEAAPASPVAVPVAQTPAPIVQTVPVEASPAPTPLPLPEVVQAPPAVSYQPSNGVSDDDDDLYDDSDDDDD